MADQPEIDAQDNAEVFDEDNLDSDGMRLRRDDEELNFDDMPDVYDATKADGDADDADAVIGDDLDDDEIVELSLQDEDETENEDDDDVLAYAGDLNTTPDAHSAAQRYESRSLSDEDLEELGYQDAPEEKKSFQRPQSAEERKADADAKAGEDERLDQGVEETFPASDPVSVKHIT